MKKITTILAAFLATTFASFAQKVETLPDGNYKVIKATTGNQNTGKPLGKTIEDNGKKYPVFISARGKLYYMKTAKNGNVYKAYIPQ